MWKKVIGDLLLTIGLVFLFMAILFIILQYPETYNLTRGEILFYYFDDYIFKPLVFSIIGIIFILVGKRLVEK